MDKSYIAPTAALRKLKVAHNLPQKVYLYGATGYGKTELVRQYLSGHRSIWFSCENLPWKTEVIPPPASGKQTHKIVVIDNLHRLKSEELRQEVITLAQRDDLWLILISRSPIPAWLMPLYIRDGFMVISEEDLRLGKGEISSYLKKCDITFTDEDLRYLQKTAEGNAYVVRHAALKLKEGKHVGPVLYEIRAVRLG